VSESSHKPFGHEPAAIAERPILLVAAILVATVVTVSLALHWGLQSYVAPHHAQIAARSGPIPPLPRLQAHATEDMAAMRAQQDALLSSYTWLDSTHTAARVPIQRAMVIYSRRHTAGARSDGSYPAQEPQQ
jgi:negative regulator of sigma E activity